MDESLTFYFGACAAAYVRGKLAHAARMPLADRRLFERELAELSPDDLARLIRLGQEAGLRLHRFKRTMGLPRVARVLGILRGLAPDDLLDIGSGRGAFLWPLLDAFPALLVTMVDQDPIRVADAQAVHDGGFSYLTAVRMDTTDLAFADNAFDVVTMLEVLEHVPAAERAVREVVRVARRSVVLSVPSREDDNPQHIHLFTRQLLGGMLHRAGAVSVRFDYVLNHMIAVARVG
jgi:ubiquinone/menaquinone biosynthesis C-methylase UbiE